MECASGYHNFVVDRGLKMGFIIFVGTEVMFFFSIFWFFFDKLYVDGNFWWVVVGKYLDWSGLPLLGTIVLLVSGIARTWSHSVVIKGKRPVLGLIITLFLGVLFLFVQGYEYTHLFFNVSDGWAGRIFYFSTGFHGLHVMLGVILLFLCLLRFLGFFYSRLNFYFFEGRVIYWHFVDVVWLFLFLRVYISRLSF